MKFSKYYLNTENGTKGRKLAICKECSIEYDTRIRNFCSMDCIKINIHKRIDEATKNEKSHSNELCKDHS